MSALQRSAIHARLSKLPHLPPLPSNEDDGDDGDESADLLGELSFAHREQGPTSTSSMRSRRTTNHHSSASSKYNPLSAASYFDQAIQVTVASSNLNFRVYYTPPILTSDGDDPHGTILVCHHGAGFSALTFACFAKQVGLQSQGRLGVLALDARSHGKTIPLNEEDSISSGSTSGTQIPIDSTPATQGSTSATQVDLSIETLTDDLVNLLTTVYSDPSLAPAFVLVGHSMGGTVVVRTCPKLQEKKYRISGVTVLDVVEGSALEAMPIMHTLLESRPQGFGTVEEAIEWHLSNHTIRNSESARVSVPSLFVPAPSDSTSRHKLLWRAPLHLTAPFWEGWFKGLSESFLAVRTARLLILAGTDRLDKTLMIGQMQGKFQLEVLPDVGHMLHEDNPDRIASLLVEFWRRNDVIRLPIKVKKVGEL
ncbi:Protein with carboxyl methyl esterase activity [Tulasnella sp. 418]|nr:Protein with carboxyl methyl esterase activity [Tulasnella sp. 418]